MYYTYLHENVYATWQHIKENQIPFRRKWTPLCNHHIMFALLLKLERSLSYRHVPRAVDTAHARAKKFFARDGFTSTQAEPNRKHFLCIRA